MRTGLAVRPATAERWSDVESLFGSNGAYSNCWCMFYRLTGREFSAAAGAGTRAGLRELVATGPAPGLLAYAAGEPVGWCALAPREEYGRVLRSPQVRPIDPNDTDVWSVTCFFIRRSERRTGVAEALLVAAVAHAAEHGARVLEGYPVEPSADRAADLYPGTVGMFRRAGFTEIRRQTPRRVVMRRTTGPQTSTPKPTTP
jgi:GNAT superfamily N-acetyltransferase